MEKNDVIETVGHITKLEKLNNVDYNILPNTLVLKNSNPFPGYGYQDAMDPTSNKPVSYFIILQYKYAPEKIIKISKMLRAKTQIICDTAYGEIMINSMEMPCIRVKRLNSITLMPSIQRFFKESGLKLMTYRNINTYGKIKVFKLFRIIKVDDKLYRDYFEKEKFYIKIEAPMNWETFEIISKSVKNEMDNPKFDAALGVIYRFNGPVEMIRIYDRNQSLDRAKKIRNLYLYNIKKERFITSSYSNEAVK